jgi:hypothetical protein
LDSIHIDSTGNVGIGLNAPAQPLHVNGNAQVDGTVYTDFVSSMSPLSLQANGTTLVYLDDVNLNVGVGTTTPGAGIMLDVVGDVRTDSQFISTVPTGTAPPLEVASTDLVVNLNADMLDGVDGADYALLPGRPGGQRLHGGTAASEDLILDSTADATKGNVRISPDGGFVGVGPSAPLAQLHVSNNAHTILAIEADADDNGDNAAGIILASGPNASNLLADIRADEAQAGRLDINGTSTNDITLALAGGKVGIGVLPINDFTVSGDSDFLGNVGIGTSTPGQPLHVAGNAKIDGTMYADTVSSQAQPLALQTDDDVHIVIDHTSGNVGIGPNPGTIPYPATEALEVDGCVKADCFIGTTDTNVEVSPIKIVKAGTSTVTTMPTLNGVMQVRATTIGPQFVMLPVDVPTSQFGVPYKLKSIHVYYKVSSKSSRIAATRASYTQGNGTSVTIIDDTTVRDDQLWSDYVLAPGAPVQIDGPLYIDFNLTYSGTGSAHDIFISRVTVTMTQN